MNESSEIVGMVDVLKLTYATLDQINTMGSSDSEGPAWNKFWLSLDQETESNVSGEGSASHTQSTKPPPSTPGGSLLTPGDEGPSSSKRPVLERMGSVMPSDSASHHGGDDEDAGLHSELGAGVAEDLPFAFKFKAASGRVHRLQVTASQGISELVASVSAKLGAEAASIGGAPTVENGKLVASADGRAGYALSYLDNEGDTVSITTDQDLHDAVGLARRSHREKVDLFVHDPDKPPVAATLNPMPDVAKPPTPPESVLRERRMASEQQQQTRESSDAEDGVAEKRERRGRRDVGAEAAQKAAKGREQEQVVQGVPNELLLPGAIAALAVVIVGVFTFSRASSR